MPLTTKSVQSCNETSPTGAHDFEEQEDSDAVLSKMRRIILSGKLLHLTWCKQRDFTSQPWRGLRPVEHLCAVFVDPVDDEDGEFGCGGSTEPTNV